MGAVNLVVLACVLRATTKNGRQLFREKSAPQEKILATLMLTYLLTLRDIYYFICYSRLSIFQFFFCFSFILLFMLI